MKLHRFYTGDKIKLKQDFWLHDEAMLWQWNKVLRFRAGREVVLFDGAQTDRLYKIEKIDKSEAHLKMVTELNRSLPKRHVYLFWALLKKDKNDLVVQKATELGVSTLVPILSERAIRDNFNLDRAKKIILEASEQCGRSDLPTIREPINLQTAIEEYRNKADLFIAHQGSKPELAFENGRRYGIFVGPEGGWSDDEIGSFDSMGLARLGLADFTLRAETAAVVATARLIQ